MVTPPPARKPQFWSGIFLDLAKAHELLRGRCPDGFAKPEELDALRALQTQWKGLHDLLLALGVDTTSGTRTTKSSSALAALIRARWLPSNASPASRRGGSARAALGVFGAARAPTGQGGRGAVEGLDEAFTGSCKPSTQFAFTNRAEKAKNGWLALSETRHKNRRESF
jgi:hypothetical protein